MYQFLNANRIQYVTQQIWKRYYGWSISQFQELISIWQLKQSMFDRDTAEMADSPLCPLCSKEFDFSAHVPILVPECGHTYCKSCVSRTVTSKANKKVFRCPKCKTEMPLKHENLIDQPKQVPSSIRPTTYQQERVKENQSEKGKKFCQNHDKPIDLFCETCEYQAICSHCALFGSHKNHTFCKEAPKQHRLTELESAFETLCLSGPQKLPAIQKVLNEARETLCEQLQKAIECKFQQYYQELQKKEQQFKKQCSKIQLKPDLTKSYQTLCNRYEELTLAFNSQWLPHFEQNSIEDINSQMADQFIQSCSEFGTQHKQLCKEVKQVSSTLSASLIKEINKSCLLKIQQLPFSLKDLQNRHQPPKYQYQKTMHKSNSTLDVLSAELKIATSPAKRIRIPSKNKDCLQAFTQKSPRIQIGETSQPIRRSFHAHNLDTLPKTHQSNGNLLNVRENRAIGSPEVSRAQEISRAIGSPEISRVNHQLTINSRMTSDKRQHSNTKSTIMSRTFVENIDSETELKYVPPTKELPGKYREKFDELKKEIDRQQNVFSLELIGAEITDTLLLYVIDYIDRKKMPFTMLKLVKNCITDEGLRMLLGYLLYNEEVQVLNLTGNALTNKCLGPIIYFAEKNRVMKIIYISNNKVNPFAVKAKKPKLDELQIKVIV